MTLDDIRRLEDKGTEAIEATEAGAAMADRRWNDPPLPHAARIWTGMLAGKRAWRGQPVILPDKTIGYIFGIRRGWASIWRPAPFVVGEREHFVLRVDQIQPYKLPSAVRLGRCKSGHREAPSTRKAKSCRKNGAMPVQPGRRPRGRPPKSSGAGKTEKPRNGF